MARVTHAIVVGNKLVNYKKKMQVAVLVHLSERRPVWFQVILFLAWKKKMSGCCTALAQALGRCLASCAPWCRGRSSEEAPAPTTTNEKTSPHPDHTSKEEREHRHELERRDREADTKNATAADGVSPFYAQMQRELAASLENLDAAGRT